MRDKGSDDTALPSTRQPAPPDAPQHHRSGDAPDTVQNPGPHPSRPLRVVRSWAPVPADRGLARRGPRFRWWTEFSMEHPRAGDVLHGLRTLLPPLNFITIHYAYFIVVTLVASVIFWGSSADNFKISYVDSLFLVVSAMTEAGLNTVNLSQMTTWQQIMLWLLILFGGAIWVSIWTVAARLHAFERRFRDIVRAERDRRDRARLSRPPSSRSLLNPAAFFKRTVTFGKAFTTPAGDPTLSGTGTKLPANGSSTETDGTPDPPVLGQRRRATLPDLHELHELELPSHASVALPVQQQSDRDHEAAQAQDGQQPEASMRVVFVEGVRSNSSAHGNRDAKAVSSAYSLENRGPRRRNVEPAWGEKDRGDDGFGTGAYAYAGNLPVQSFLTDKTVGRNSQFHGLTSEERAHLGGCEYRALRFLSVMVPLYFVLWQLLGCVALGAWIANNQASSATTNGINPWWAGAFYGVSAFNNSGMALLDANMIPFQNAFFMLIVMGAMVLAGNTAYPILLRFIIWTMLEALRRWTDDETLAGFKETLKFILKYPRRVYTNLFPSRPTWWLLFMVIWLNCVDWVAFELLNFGNPTIEAIPTGSRVIDGLFQAVAVRSGGFYVVPISQVFIGLQVLYVIMMYISVYPVVITMRHSNVYEERSLGIYEGDPEPEDQDPELGNGGPSAARGGDDPLDTAATTPLSRRRSRTSVTRATTAHAAADLGRTLRRFLTAWHGVGVPPGTTGAEADESRMSFISQQVHGQLAHDIWWLVLAVLVITTIETSHFLADPVAYSVFNVVFEVVSAYGTVGISVGLPSAAYSFSGGWHPASKVVLCLVMLRGRHRGLPVALDRAVRLPGEQLHREEEEDAMIRRSMTVRRASVDG